LPSDANSWAPAINGRVSAAAPITIPSRLLPTRTLRGWARQSSSITKLILCL
jgi:hypothetical protein